MYFDFRVRSSFLVYLCEEVFSGDRGMKCLEGIVGYEGWDRFYLRLGEMILADDACLLAGYGGSAIVRHMATVLLRQCDMSKAEWGWEEMHFLIRMMEDYGSEYCGCRENYYDEADELFLRVYPEKLAKLSRKLRKKKKKNVQDRKRRKIDAHPSPSA